MRIAIFVTLVPTCFAAFPNDQGIIAPDDAKAHELKELLALDSFNVTASDPEQNRMHAICDMEYRLSKLSGLAQPALPLSNLLLTPAAPQLPFNPFTMPLAAVNAHMALLTKQKEYLEAQSAAFGGSSSGATTASPSTDLLTISSACNVDAGTHTCATARNAALDLDIKFTTSQEMPVGYKLVFTVKGMVDTTATALSDTALVITEAAAATKPIFDDKGTGSTADDGKAMYTDNSEYERTAAADAPGGYEGTTAAGVKAFAVMSGTAVHTFPTATLSFSMQIGPLTKALKKIDGGRLTIKTITVRSTAAGLKEHIEGAVLDADGTLKSTSTTIVDI